MLKILVLSIINLYSFSLFAKAETCATPGIEVAKDLFDIIEEIPKKKREWFAASDELIKNAPCRREYPSDTERDDYLKKLMSGSLEREDNINGVQLKDTPEMLSLFKDLTTFNEMESLKKEDTDGKDLKKIYMLNPDCKKVLCTLTSMFGEKRARDMLFMKQKFGFNISPAIRSPSQSFTDKELVNLKKGMMDFPLSMLPYQSNKGCTKLHKDQSFGLGVSANAMIWMTEVWTNYSPERMQAIMFHEMSHNIGQSKKLDTSEEWLKISGWVDRVEYWIPSEKKFISDYSYANPQEDFAESMVGYRYDPVTLKKIAPEKYEFIKNKVFGGIEYTGALMCHDSNLVVQKAFAKIKSDLKNFKTSDIDEKMKHGLVKYCDQDSLEFLFDRNYSPIHDCLQGAIALELAKKQVMKEHPEMAIDEVEKNYFSLLSGRTAKAVLGVNFTIPQIQDIKNYSHDLMDDYEMKAYKSIELYIEYKDKESYCAGFAHKYVNQKFSDLNKDMGADKLLIYKRAEELVLMVSKKCIRVQNVISPFRPFKENDYKALLR